MRARNSGSYLDYLDKLVDECNNIRHRPIVRKPIRADYPAFPEESESNHKAPEFKAFLNAIALSPTMLCYAIV